MTKKPGTEREFPPRVSLYIEYIGRNVYAPTLRGWTKAFPKLDDPIEYLPLAEHDAATARLSAEIETLELALATQGVDFGHELERLETQSNEDDIIRSNLRKELAAEQERSKALVEALKELVNVPVGVKTNHFSAEVRYPAREALAKHNDALAIGKEQNEQD